MRVRRFRIVAGATSVVLIAGCATTSIDQQNRQLQELTTPTLGAPAALRSTDPARAEARRNVQQRLVNSLSADDAVRAALDNSPALQALLSEHVEATAAAVQSARISNPVFTFERLVRGDVTEFGRMLSLSLLDVLTLPARSRIADQTAQTNTVRAAAELVQLANEVRAAWVQAVAAHQQVNYYADVRSAAETAAELAQRMQGVGSFNKLQRAREQAFYADAVTQQARAQHAATAARERLVRLLGLDAEQSAMLKLPERLPDLPAAPREAAALQRQAFEQRLDVRLARHNLDATAAAHGLTRVTSWVDALHLGVIRNSETGEPVQRGYEVELPLPLFDFGDARRAGSQAAYLAALNRTAQVAVDARSQVNEAYSGYRTAFDIARHYRDEIVPLRKMIADENLLRYNGMLIGVFELLADARAQVASVITAIDAQKDFWLADATLNAALIGRPIMSISLATPRAAGETGGEAGGH
ncbi:MAG TPA: TolC family protein [Burkholderiaceae bacterium]|nr:TolC family protein [Burkholderiaceae bacterium]